MTIANGSLADATDLLVEHNANGTHKVGLTGKFNDAEGDPVAVDNTAAADGTSTYAARRDHRHRAAHVGTTSAVHGLAANYYPVGAVEGVARIAKGNSGSQTFGSAVAWTGAYSHTVAVTFVTAFPSACYCALVAIAGGSPAYTGGWSASGFNAYYIDNVTPGGGSKSIGYIAMGY